LQSASIDFPIDRAAWLTIPVAASVATNRCCSSGVIELRRGRGWR
jgi:hypothetical protein